MVSSFVSSSLPVDYKKNIIEMKRVLRAQAGDVEALFEQVCAAVEREIADARRQETETGSAWPELSLQQLMRGETDSRQIALIKRRGCVVVRQTFAREQALTMDRAMLDYLDDNHFDEQYRGPGDNFFGTLTASRPEIFPIYWSPSQMQARQSPAIASVQSFLNRLWNFESAQGRWFDPDTSILYPDRIRRRPPGTCSQGLGAHTDSGALERWLSPAYQQVYAAIFNGRLAEYDPWDAAWRPQADEYQVENTTTCSAFRTFQGWTALSDMDIGQGLLHVVPTPLAMAYILLRPLLKDVPEDELCGVAPGRVLPVSQQWHPHLINGLCSIPSLKAGDSVWWHCDLIHAVAPVENQQGWGNVMYIPAAPLCEKNARYARRVRDAFERGASPADFPPEDYETRWQGRFSAEQLNETGRRSLGME